MAEPVEPVTVIKARPSKRPGAVRASSSGFAGLRIAGAVLVASFLGGLGGVAATAALDHLDQRASTTLRADLEQRAEAGRTAMSALEGLENETASLASASAEARRRAAKARAAAIALEASIGLDRLAKDEASGMLDVSHDRVLASSWARLVAGATLSRAIPDLWNKVKQNPAGALLDDGRGVIAFGPVIAEGRLSFGRVEIPVGAEDGASLRAGLARATNALVSLAAPVDPIMPGRHELSFALAGALAGALLAFFWAKFRLGGPLDASLFVARAFAHGGSQSRADEKQGGRDARDVARAVNALIDCAERLKVQGRAAREEDVRALALAIRALGNGDLASPIPDVSDTLGPVRDAIEAARREMLGRLGEIQRMTIEVADNASEVGPGAKKVSRAAIEQLEALRLLATDADQATQEVKAATERLGDATKSLARFADGERKAAREVQNALLGAARRVLDLKNGAARLESLAATSVAIEEALDVLGQAANADNPPAKTRITNAVGQGRAAMESMSRELALLREEMGGAAANLESIARTVPDSGVELEGVVAQSLHEAAAKLLRIVERTAAGIKTLERSAKAVSEGAGAIAKGAASNAELAPKIGAKVAEFSLGPSFEEALKDRLDRWKKAAEAAKTAPDGLTEDGRQMVKQVVEASEQARQRLARLVSVTESAIDVLRG
jgi:methyl-accepting chemotaxis protein